MIQSCNFPQLKNVIIKIKNALLFVCQSESFFYALFIFFIFFIYKFISNTVSWLKIRYYRKRYINYITNPNFDFMVYTESITKLFQRAGIKQDLSKTCEYLGAGLFSPGKFSLFKNMGVLREDIPPKMINLFSRAEGAFRARALECFSPFYWIESLLFLPQKIIKYIGLNSDNVFSRISQILYWIIVTLLVAFRTNIYHYILELLRNL